MDLKQFDTLSAVEKGFTYTVKYPYGDMKGEDTNIKIDVLGVGCQAYKNAVKKMDKYRENCYKQGKAPEEDRLEELAIEALIACTRGWEGVEEDGKAVPFNKENAQRIYAEYPWLVAQATEAMTNVEEMLKGN